MAYDLATVTNSGNQLLASVASDNSYLVIDKIEVSGTQLASSTDLKTMTSISNVVQTLSANGYQKKDTSFIISTVLDNSSVKVDYKAWVFGIWAHKSDGGSSVLMSVITSTNSPDTISKGSGTPIDYNYKFITTFSNTDSLKIKMSSDTYATNDTVLHNSGDETATGTKTFQKIKISNDKFPSLVQTDGQYITLDGGNTEIVPADNSKVVHTTGDETIDGKKKFDTDPTDSAGNAYAKTVDVNQQLDKKVTDNKDGTEQLNGVKVQPFNKLSDVINLRNIVLQTDNVPPYTANGAKGNVLKVFPLYDKFSSLPSGTQIYYSYDLVVTNADGGSPWLSWSDPWNTFAGWKPIATDGIHHFQGTAIIPDKDIVSGQTIVSTIDNSHATYQLKNLMIIVGSIPVTHLPAPEDKVNVSDMRKPASDVVGLEDVSTSVYRGGIEKNTDLNTLTQEGIYNFGAPLVNFIDSEYHWGTIYVTYKSGVVFQYVITTSRAGNQIYFRTQSGSPAKWVPWTMVSAFGMDNRLTLPNGEQIKPADDSKVVHDNHDNTITANNLRYDLSKTCLTPLSFYDSGSFNDLPLGTVLANGTSMTDGPDRFHAYNTTTFSSGEWGGRKAQVAIADNVNLMYFRVATGPSWQSWTLLSDDSKVAHSADVSTSVYQSQLANGTDIHTITKDGIYPLGWTYINFIDSRYHWGTLQVININAVIIHIARIESAIWFETRSGSPAWWSPWHKLSLDDEVAHLSGANNFDTIPTVDNNPLLLASSLPSGLARTGSNQEFTGKNTFDTAPIDKTTGNPYITKDGVPSDLARTGQANTFNLTQTFSQGVKTLQTGSYDDANLLVNEGLYYNTNSSIKNGAASLTTGYIQVMSGGREIVRQIMYSDTDAGLIYDRVSQNGGSSWSNWVEILAWDQIPDDIAVLDEDSNFTAKLQKSGIDVATTTDVKNAVNTATANMVDTTKPANFTAGLQKGGIDVATAADLKSVENSAWRQLNVPSKIFDSYEGIYKINVDEKYLEICASGILSGQNDDKTIFDLSPIIDNILNIDMELIVFNDLFIAGVNFNGPLLIQGAGGYGNVSQIHAHISSYKNNGFARVYYDNLQPGVI